jgi:hypothetical protein
MNEEELKKGYLVYCIVTNLGTQSHRGLLGVDGQPVFLIPSNGLTAVVSRINRVDTTPSISQLLAHKEVVESFHRNPAVRGVIPMRYGCMVDDQAQILRLLEKHRSHYTALLKEVEGCVEMGVRILISDCGMRNADWGLRPPAPLLARRASRPEGWGLRPGGNADSETPIQQIANPWPRPGMPGSSNGRTDMEQQQKQENIQITSHQGGRKSPIANPGKAYLAARKAHYAQDERFNNQVAQVIERCRAAFDGLFEKCKAEVPSIVNFQSSIFNRQFSIVNIFPSIYYLVPRSSVNRFRQVFRQVNVKECPKLLLSGPWPPYNFVQPEHTGGGIFQGPGFRVQERPTHLRTTCITPERNGRYTD